MQKLQNPFEYKGKLSTPIYLSNNLIDWPLFVSLSQEYVSSTIIFAGLPKTLSCMISTKNIHIDKK